MRLSSLSATLVIPAQLVLAQQIRPATASTAGSALTLEDAVSTARQNNPAFLTVESNLRSAESQVRQAYAALLPNSFASLSTRYQQGGTQFVQGVAIGGSADSRQSSYSLSLGYSVSPSTIYAPRSARASRDASAADITTQAEALRSQVAQQYITTLQAEAQGELQDSLAHTAQGQLDLASARMEAGAGTVLDVRTAEVALGQARVNQLTSHNQVKIEKLRLFQLMGVPADTSVRLTTQFAVTQPTFSLDSLLDLGRKVNPDIAAKKSREYASQMNVRAAGASYLPSLSLNTGWGGNAFTYVDPNILVAQTTASLASQARSCTTSDSIRTLVGLAPIVCGSGQITQAQIDAIRSSNNQFPFKFNRNPIGVSASLSLPIFNNYQREAQLEQAKVQRDNARYDLRSRDLQLTTEITQAYLNLTTAATTAQLQEQIAAKATEELSFAQESYRVGAKTFLDVTTARGQYEQALIARVNAIYDYHKAFAALETAIGRPLR